MKHVAAYMLAALGGNANPSAADVKKILNAVGAKVDDACLDKVVSELNGKNLEELVAAGAAKLATVSMGGGGGGGGGGGAAAAPAAGGGGGGGGGVAPAPILPSRNPPFRAPHWRSLQLGLHALAGCQHPAGRRRILPLARASPQRAFCFRGANA